MSVGSGVSVIVGVGVLVGRGVAVGVAVGCGVDVPVGMIVTVADGRGVAVAAAILAAACVGVGVVSLCPQAANNNKADSSRICLKREYTTWLHITGCPFHKKARAGFASQPVLFSNCYTDNLRD